MRLYLGTHEPGWLARSPVPLMVSHRRLGRRPCHARAAVPWVLDSGGFTELAMHGGWVTTPAAYVTAARAHSAEQGPFVWAAPQDWMCEPSMLARTGLTVAEHQRRTIASVLELRHRAAELPWIPVLQGWTLDDYLRHADAYAAAGVDLAGEATVGLGSVCRRQATTEIAALVGRLSLSFRLHGFGVKGSGLARYGSWLTSADSLAWSYGARFNGGNANGLADALAWYDRQIIDARPVQLCLTP